MKKLLIATTALVATAGVAAAEVTISGNGRMGVVYDGEDLQFTSRVRADISMSGTTDGGLEFGGSFGVHNAGDRSTGCIFGPDGCADVNGGGANQGNSGSIWISGAFGKLEMGDVVGAAENAVGNLPGVGLTGLGDLNDMSYLTGDGVRTHPGNPVVLYTYTSGGLSLSVSMNDGEDNFLVDQDSQEFAVGVKYSFGDYAVAVGYEVVDPAAGPSFDHAIIGVSATFGSTTANLIYGKMDGDNSQLGIGVSSTFDAVTINAFAKQVSSGPVDVNSYGIGASYDLGGGAKVVGGVADSDAWDGAQADIGLSFSF